MERISNLVQTFFLASRVRNMLREASVNIVEKSRRLREALEKKSISHWLQYKYSIKSEKKKKKCIKINAFRYSD